MRIARYPQEDSDGRAFSLVCSRATAEETIEAANAVLLPILREGGYTCRQDIGSTALEFLRQKTDAGNRVLKSAGKAHRETFFQRVKKWLTRE
jgi:hypothetical protein